MTQHIRGGRDAKEIRKRRADERAGYMESLSEEDQEKIKAFNKATYDEKMAA